MPSGRIPVSPVQQATLCIPFVLASDQDLIADSQPIQSWGQVDIVRYQQRAAAMCSDNEALVPGSVPIVG
jgi:hypothetical protein